MHCQVLWSSLKLANLGSHSSYMVFFAAALHTLCASIFAKSQGIFGVRGSTIMLVSCQVFSSKYVASPA
ncbi:hypothetical protein CsSME_00012260 [Camellia sinensis var. sinensis]